MTSPRKVKINKGRSYNLDCAEGSVKAYEQDKQNKNKLIADISALEKQAGRFEFLDESDNVSWIIKHKFVLGKGKWKLYFRNKEEKEELIGKMTVKAFVRRYELMMPRKTKYGDVGSLKIEFNDAQTEFTIQRSDKQARLVSAFNSTTGRKVAETSAGTVRVASGELRNFMLAVSCLFIFLMQEFNNRPTRFLKKWNQTDASPTSEPEVALDSASPRTPGARSVTSKIDADSGSPSPVKLKTKGKKEKEDESDEKPDTSATDTGEEKREKKGESSENESEETSDDKPAKEKEKSKASKKTKGDKSSDDEEASSSDNSSDKKEPKKGKKKDEESSDPTTEDSDSESKSTEGKKGKNKEDSKGKGNKTDTNKGKSKIAALLAEGGEDEVFPDQIIVRAKENGYLIQVGDYYANKTVTVTVRIDNKIVGGPYTLDLKE